MKKQSLFPSLMWLSPVCASAAVGSWPVSVDFTDGNPYQPVPLVGKRGWSINQGNARAAGAPFWTRERDYTRYAEQQATLTLKRADVITSRCCAMRRAGIIGPQWRGPSRAPRPPLIPPEVPIGVFTADSEDLDDDGLPDAWEAESDLDIHDRGTVGRSSSPWGGRDADGLTNLEEWHPGTSPASFDSDGDGIKVNLTGINPAFQDSQKLKPMATLSGSAGNAMSGRTDNVETALRTQSQSGTAFFPKNLKSDGVVIPTMGARILLAPLSIPLMLKVLVDSQDTGTVDLMQAASENFRAFAWVSILYQGTHNFELAWTIPQREKYLLFDKLILYTSSGPLSKDLAANTLGIAPAAAGSLTSPFCPEGNATFSAFVRLAGKSDTRTLPDSAWYGDIPLPDAAFPLAVTVNFENGLARKEITLHWKAWNIFTCNSFVIRAVDSMRLKAYPGDQAAEDARIRILVGGGAEYSLSPDQGAPCRFDTPGHYEILGEYFSAGSGTLEVRKTTVTVVDRKRQDDINFAAGQLVMITFPELPPQTELTADSSVYFRETLETSPREFSVLRAKAGSVLAAHRLPSHGAVLGTFNIHSFRVLSDMDTWHGSAQSGLGSLLMDMDVLLPGMPRNKRVKIEILASGVTFEDGSVVKSITLDDVNTDGIAGIRFLMTSCLNTSFCHRMTLYDGDRILGDW